MLYAWLLHLATPTQIQPHFLLIVSGRSSYNWTELNKIFECIAQHTTAMHNFQATTGHSRKIILHLFET